MMNKGRIIDCTVQVKPSKKLIDFILQLEDEKVVPENILKILQKYGDNPNLKREIFKSDISQKSLSDDQKKFLKELQINENDKNFKKYINKKFDYNAQNIDNEERIEDIKDSKDHKNIKNKMNNKPNTEELYLVIKDLKWIKQIINEKRKTNSNIEYLHEILENCDIILPENEIIPRNPILEKRCKKLKAEYEAKLYRDMTKNVDTSRLDTPEDTIGYQLKSIDRQLIAVLQFLFSVAAGFAFGFIGVELIIGNLEFGFRLLLGIMCALIVAIAEIYFLAKKLSEYDEIE